MADAKMLRVVGLSSAVLFDLKDPLNPINRRISIIVMNKKTEDSITKENRTIEVADEETATETVGKGVHISGEVQPTPMGAPVPTPAPAPVSVAPKPTANATAASAAAAAAAVGR
jgi:chemotaxis protein MotB